MVTQIARARRRALSSLAVSLLPFAMAWSASPRSLYAQTELERAGARDAAVQGVEAFEKRDYAQALDLLERAESVVHAPTHLLYMARSAAAQGRLVRAREIYLRLRREQLAAQAPQAFVDAQRAGTEELSALEPRIPRLKIVVSGAKDTQVRIDEQPIPPGLVGVALPIDPGKHRISAQAQDGKRTERHLELQEGTTETVTLNLSAVAGGLASPNVPSQNLGSAAVATPTASTPPPSTVASNSSRSSTSILRVASYVAFGVGVVGLGGGTYFMLRYGSQSDDADKLFAKYDCPNCLVSEKAKVLALDDKAASAKTWGTAGLITGGVGIAAGVTCFVLSMKMPATQSGWVLPYAGANEFGLVGNF